MQAWMWVQGKRSSSEMRKKCVLLLSKILNSAELLLGVVWNSIRAVLCCAVLCCAEEGREGKLSASIRCWQYVQNSLWDASFWIWTRFKTSEVDTACNLSQNDLLYKSLTHLFFRSFSHDFEGECDRFGWWFVCVYMWFSLWCWRRPRVQGKVLACSWRELRMRPAAGRV